MLAAAGAGAHCSSVAEEGSLFGGQLHHQSTKDPICGEVQHSETFLQLPAADAASSSPSSAKAGQDQVLAFRGHHWPSNNRMDRSG
ncbi:hypothetical protein MCOR27_011449 [Pyricularia oryzae]|nr:hypothetical protein MCOR19_011476 [Pyricularia oryzae]KAI6265317.1 hypothetical protein MCOR27_011449 [Pyricularia oryzae]KAI6315995.1 hypothetical protein MCOR30_009509 [Pyricularia oryzae]KAI6385013.1 hypothetical protein MCOR32_001848 [Pyricularia oryzae]KAI6393680.1 hypothetical protein MCOR23_007888 [Pyricularia oryzae]